MTAVFSLLFLLAIAASHSLASDEEWVGKGVLKVDVLTETLVQGTYVAVSGRGIRFAFGGGSLLVTTLDGHPLIVGETAVGEFRVFTIDGNDFILKGDVQYAVPKRFPTVRGSTDENKLNSLVGRLDAISREAHDAIFESSVRAMVTRPETALLKPAAFALGEGRNITGIGYPVVLPFYMVVLKIESIFEKKIALESSRQKRAGCFNECPPCKNDNCLGLCGLSCTCWRFICDDCCFHQFCYTHDLCCRNSFFSKGCLGVVFTFGRVDCQSTYRDC